MRSLILGQLVLVLVCGAAGGCMDKLYDYERCVDIESARCDLRDRCIDGFDVETCYAYYEEFCRTRKLKNDKGIDKTDVEECVAAIEALPCEALYDTEGALAAVDETASLPECDFIETPDDDADAGGDTDVDTDTDPGDAGV